jgi:hypothetical protein
MRSHPSEPDENRLDRNSIGIQLREYDASRLSIRGEESMRDMIRERERALEDEFFASKDRELLDRMRAEAEAATNRQALARVTGIKDTDLLDSLLGAGVGAENVASLTLVPLVFVAWADHRMVDVERRAVLDAAHKLGIDPEGATSALLAGWLEVRPPEKLFTAWKAWLRVVAAALSQGEQARLAEQILSHCRDIAHAAGGFLETGRPADPGERSVIEEIQTLFDEVTEQR